MSEPIERPKMTERGLLGQIMDSAWPEYGGNHMPVEFWHDFSEGAQFVLRCLGDWKLRSEGGE